MKQKVKNQLREIGDRIDDSSIDFAITLLQKLKEEYSQYELSLQLEYEDYSDYKTLFLYGERDETDEEENKRLKAEKEWKELQRIRDEKELQRLKEKLKK